MCFLGITVEDRWILIIALIVVIGLVTPPTYYFRENNINYLKIEYLVMEDLISTLRVNYTVVELNWSDPPWRGYDNTSDIYTYDLKEFVSIARTLNVNIIYSSPVLLYVFDPNSATIHIYSFYHDIYVIKGFPSDEYFWINPITEKKVKAGWAFIKLTEGVPLDK